MSFRKDNILRFTLTVLSFLISETIIAQKIKVKTMARLPKTIWETSGIVSGTNSTIWTHNDSGGKPILYKIDTNGVILRTLFIKDVKNRDWEDLANDYQGNIYIADIGNNRNQRKDLQILKIPHPDSVETDSIKPEIIRFNYENQMAFPPKESELNFDAEALIAYEDSIFIFTKNRTKPYSKYTYIYTLANRSGTQIALLIDSIYLPHTHKLHSWVTSATRSPTGDLIILISHKKAWVIKNFRQQSDRVLIQTKVSGIYSQKEAIAFDLEGNIWITNEKYKFLRSKLKKSVSNNFITK